jgi:hypothetical protein
MQVDTDLSPDRNTGSPLKAFTRSWENAIGLFTLFAIFLSVCWLCGFSDYQPAQALAVTLIWLFLTAMVFLLDWRYRPGSDLRWTRRCLVVPIVWAAVWMVVSFA